MTSWAPRPRRPSPSSRSWARPSITPILAALPDADKHSTVAFVDVLAALATAKTFPDLRRRAGAREPAGHCRRGLGADQQPQLSAAPAARGAGQARRIQIRRARGHQRPAHPLLHPRAADRRLRAGAQRESRAVPHHRRDGRRCRRCPSSLGRLQGKDSIARLQILGVLGRFNRPDVRVALQAQLGDGNKLIRSAALAALAKMDGPIEVGAHLRPAARSGDRGAEPRRRGADQGEAIRRPSATWCRC